jgi:hypothetical protein
MNIPLCRRCKREEVEVIDDWESVQCRRCNDRDIERTSRRQEWDHYHPGEPCPESELG